MPTDGLIFALDIATHTGFAVGLPGQMPRSGVVTLKKRGEPHSEAFFNMMRFLEAQWRRERPVLVAKEAHLRLQAYQMFGNSEARIELDFGLHAIVEAMARSFGIPCEQAEAVTIRKHFLGKARMGSREETKMAVVKRCHLLGLMPKDRFDDNRADACATWDWACAKYMRKSVTGKTLYLWGETNAQGAVPAS